MMWTKNLQPFGPKLLHADWLPGRTSEYHADTMMLWVNKLKDKATAGVH